MRRRCGDVEGRVVGEQGYSPSQRGKSKAVSRVELVVGEDVRRRCGDVGGEWWGRAVNERGC